MRETRQLLIIGGDKRQLYMADALHKKGYAVSLCAFAVHEGFGHLHMVDGALDAAIREADAVVLPLPASRDEVLVNAPFTNTPPALETVLQAMQKEKPVFAGMLSQAWKTAFFKQGVPVYDYFEREELTVRNAIPTAQGIIKVMLEQIDFTLHDSQILITGYGRCARILAGALRGLGAHVTVAARKVKDLAWAQADGARGILLSSLAASAADFDIAVNTVPARILDRETLACFRPDCLFIEIASPPYGIDLAAAEALGCKVILAPSLPGKVAPKTAGGYISDAVDNMIKEGIQWIR